MKQRLPQLAKRQGIIFILSAPSGAGKTTLYNGLRKIYPDIQLSVSCTTRGRRRGEVPGRDYRFLSEARFEALKNRGEFAEWAQVHDYRYGTPRKPTRPGGYGRPRHSARYRCPRGAKDQKCLPSGGGGVRATPLPGRISAPLVYARHRGPPSDPAPPGQC